MSLAIHIVFTGRLDLDQLSEAQDKQPGASQPGDARLKSEAGLARYRFKCGRWLDNRVRQGERIDYLDEHERRLLADFRTGTLLRERNSAVLAYGHGKLVDERGVVVEIGGSTGGMTRKLMNTYAEPDLDAWRR